MNPFIYDNFRDFAASLPALPGAVRWTTGPLAEIIIDAPATRNALHPGMMVAFADAVEAVAGARVVLLRGQGGAFCSGGDLGAVRDHLTRPGAGAGLARFMHRATEPLAGLDAVVIAAVTGPALGGGAELLSACDVVIASRDARVGWVQVRLGVSPGFGGGTRLVTRLGPRAALNILTDARTYSAEEARTLGLVDELADDPVARANERAHALLALPEAALRGVVATVRAASHLPREAALEAERALFDGLWGGPAHLSALGTSPVGRPPAPPPRRGGRRGKA